MTRKRYGRSILAHLFWSMVRSPWPIVGFFENALLVVALLAVFRGFAGFVPDGRMLSTFAGLMIGVGVLHLIRHVGDPNSRLRFYPAMLYPLPFIGYIGLHAAGLSTRPWEAELSLAVLLLAYTVFCLSLSVTRKGQGRTTYLVLMHILGFVVLVVGFLQFYIFRDWTPFLDRLRNPDFAYGPAGFFAEPSNLAGLILLILPTAIFILWLPRFPGPVRILMGLISFAGLVGYFLSSHMWGLVLLLLLLLVLPFFLSPEPRTRFRMYLWGGILILFLIPFAWFGTDALHLRMLMIYENVPDLVALASREVAYAAFMQAPLLGHGVGAFPVLWQQMIPAGLEGTVHHPASFYADLLAETGVIGLLLFIVPVALLWGRAWSYWRSLQLFRPDPDIENRIKRMSSRRRAELRRKLTKGKAPASKVILGGLLMGWVFFALYLIHDNSLRLAGVLFVGALSAGVVIVFSYQGDTHARMRKGRIFMASLPLSLSLLAYGYGVPRFHAAYMLTDSKDRLHSVMQNPYRIFQDPGVVSDIELQLALVLDLDPDHAEAMAWMGEAILARSHMDLFSARAIAEAAAPVLREAIDREPNQWRALFNYARVLGMRGSGTAEMLPYLDRAVELAPTRVEPAALAAAIRILDGTDADAALEAFHAALRLNPDYAPAKTFSERLMMSGGSRIAGGGILSPALLAEQFELKYGQQERMSGSGLLAPDAIGGTMVPEIN